MGVMDGLTSVDCVRADSGARGVEAACSGFQVGLEAITTIPLRFAVLVAAAAVFCSLALAADGNQALLSERRAPAAPPDFRIESDLVLIPVNVTDASNHTVTGLGRDAFRVFEDQTEQRVVQFAEEDVPISAGIVLDSSGSMVGKLPKAREALKQFLDFANPEDEFCLVEFSGRPRLTVPFTSDPGEIRGRLLNTQPKGTTALLDAIALALNTLKHARHQRRVLLVLSDGADNHSRYTAAEIRDRIRESDVWIYAMGMYDRNALAAPAELAAGQKLLRLLADDSGGRHFAVSSLIDLPVIAARISVELRNQYVLGYRPANPARDGKYHHVQVSIVDGRRLVVSWRQGYYGSTE